MSKKYTVEDDINFFDELKSSLKGSESAKELKELKESLCLISNSALSEHHMTLKCGHSFNYLPLYNEVKCQKTQKNHMEVTRLLWNEIKCPYCRKIHQGNLPFHESLKEQAPKIFSVNCSSPVPTVHKQVLKKTIAVCPQLLKTGVNKGAPCGKNVQQNGLCGRHYNMSVKPIFNTTTTVTTVVTIMTMVPE